MFNNYEILEHRYINDLNSDGYILKHIKTGAMVTLLLNDDENKVFYIGFRTPPEDSTGVAHILEHSTLCGSAKYPVKDPFIELAKGSLNTFLNAMTYPDKTVYPVASCNDKDFHNLVDVYLDAVFHPNIYNEKKIFMQEGWHYEMESLEDELTVNGVVYNEMKGVYSSPDDLVEQEIMQSLYPDNTYRFVSGGDPDYIPELDYEEFLDFHDKLYHPSNSFLYLYGNMDAEEYLKYIDEEYLSKYEYLKVDSTINLQKPFEKPLRLSKYYPVLEDGESDGDYLSYNVTMGTSLDPKLYVAIDILDYVLISAPGAIIKQALIDEGIGEDVYSSVEGGILQPYFSIIAKNASVKREEEFVSIIENKLSELKKNGLPLKSIKAAINHFEFKYREADFGSFPRGLMLGLQALDSWNYDPMSFFMHIEANATYEFLKKAAEEGYFEKLIEEYFLNNNHKTIISFVPKTGLTAQKDEQLKKKLADLKASLSKEELQRIVDETAELKAYQSEPSPKEDLEKIPLLSREDLTKEARKMVNEIHTVNGTKVLCHDVFSNGIGYLNLMFSIDDVPEDLYKYIGILKSVLGYIDTKNYSFSDYFDEINIHTGGLITTSTSFTDKNNNKDVKNYLLVKVKMLYDKTPKAFELIKEMICDSKFEDTKRLKEILLETRARMESSMQAAGHGVAMSRALSYFSIGASYDEEMNGLSFYKLIKKLTEDFDNCKDDIVSKLRELMVCIFRPENLFVDITATQEEFKIVEDELSAFISILNTDEYRRNCPFVPNPSKRNEGLMTAGQVQYVCRAGEFVSKGLKYTGALKVLHTILGYDYLWNNVRVLGGAYGVMNGFTRNGSGFIVSYRDPNMVNTIKVYEGAAEYIENMPLDERTITQFIIGTLSEVDTPLTPSSKGAYSLRGYMTGLEDSELQKERDEILNINEDIIHGLSKYLRAIMEDRNLCVVGNADVIKKDADIFMNIEQLV